jgi:hypothetical protein
MRGFNLLRLSVDREGIGTMHILQRRKAINLSKDQLAFVRFVIR